ncbi:condensation domain-containing protein [Streptomyces sp. 372A]|uniref:condensation domain-containing protein n=1 Tax=Streptomyces sp. SAS_281 TaxID=3412744 RepID=UPI00403C36C1
MTEAQTVVEASGPDSESKSYPLTWAQATMWEYVQALGTQARALNLPRRRLLRAPRSTGQVLAALAGFVAECDVARTTFDVIRRTQVIRPAAALPIRVVDSGGDPAAAAADLASELAGTAFSLDTDLPVRFGLVVDGEEVRSVAVAYSHLVFDAFSHPLVSGFLERSLEGAAEGTPHVGDLVRREATDRMRERSDAALSHWSSALSALPPGRGFRLPSAGSYTEWALHSREAAVAAQTVATRNRVHTSSVLLAALGAALRSVLADPPAALLLVASNRHHPDLAGFAGIALQIGLHVIPPADREGTVDAYLRSTQDSAIRGYAKARYDTTRWREMLVAMTERGTAPDLSFYFNDARMSRGWDGLEHQAGQLASWRPGDANVTAVASHRVRDATMFAYALDGGPAARIHLVCDDAVIPPPQAEAVLRALEEYLVGRALAG